MRPLINHPSYLLLFPNRTWEGQSHCSDSSHCPLQAVTARIHPLETVIFSPLLLALSLVILLPSKKHGQSLPCLPCYITDVVFLSSGSLSQLHRSSWTLVVLHWNLLPLLQADIIFSILLFLRVLFSHFHYTLLSHSPLPINFFPPMLLPLGISPLPPQLWRSCPQSPIPSPCSCCWLPFHVSF